VYLGLKTNEAPLPDKFFEWQMAFRTGWTLDYIRSLTMQDRQDYLQVVDGMIKAGIR